MTTFEGMKVGDYFQGQYEVSNVVGSTEDGGSKAQFWSTHTDRDFYKETCGIRGCGNPAQVGGHMWVKGLRKFCVILPICSTHNNDTSLYYQKGNPTCYQLTKADAHLVVHNTTDGMWE